MRRLVPVLALCVLGLIPSVAGAAPGSGAATVVSMGDSYISGEAGRWQGNSLSPCRGGRAGAAACAGSPGHVVRPASL